MQLASVPSVDSPLAVAQEWGGGGGGWSPHLFRVEPPYFRPPQFFLSLPKGVSCWKIEFCVLKKMEPPPIEKHFPTPLFRSRKLHLRSGG